MLLTKRYFKKFQYRLLAACIVSAATVGSIQTAFIIREVSKAKKAGRKTERRKK